MTANLTKEAKKKKKTSEVGVTQKHVWKQGKKAFVLWEILVKDIASDMGLMDLNAETVLKHLNLYVCASKHYYTNQNQYIVVIHI